MVSVKGWRLDAYRRNPVFLWAHDYAQPAIGRAVDVWTDESGLLATMEFAPTEFAQEIAGLYRGGYQRGVSVGFRPLRYEMRRDDHTGRVLGINFMEQELLEISAAPVPANQNALRKALDSAPRMRGYYQYRGLGGQSNAEEEPDFDTISALAPKDVTGAKGPAQSGGPYVAWETALSEILDALKRARL